MRARLLVAGLGCIVTLFAATTTQAIEPKSIAELDLMDDGELVWEAALNCSTLNASIIVYGAGNWHDPKQVKAMDYMDTIERVARKHHGGKTPPIYGKLRTASRDTSREYPEGPCFHVAHTDPAFVKYLKAKARQGRGNDSE
ncbi:MAG: hypothetical protein ACHQ4J_14510 [Candidatus Binatia bacterium]